MSVVNREFAVKMFGSAVNALGHFYKLRDGTRIQVVGIVESGKYKGVTDDSAPAMFFPILQSPTLATNLVIRSSRDPRQVAGAIKNTLRDLDRGLPYYLSTWGQQLDDFALFPSHVATISLGVLGAMGAMLSITGIFGMAAYSVSRRLKELGIRIAIGGASPGEVFAGGVGTRLQAARGWFRGWVDPWDFGHQGAGFDRVSSESSRSGSAGRRGYRHAAAGASGYLDPGAACAVD